MSSADPLLPLREGRHARELVTPEGVPLVFRLAPLGERLGALLIDLLLQLAGLFLLGLVPLLMGLGSGWLMALVTLVFFFARNFYFVFFELRWQGQTPGKRTIGLRVIDASGGVLTAEAIFARNLTRELEVFWPLVALAAPKQVSGLEGGWLALAAVAWILALGLIPFLNRDRRRLGDLVAGTLVVRARVGRERLRAEVARRLPFETEIVICHGREIVRLMSQDFLAGERQRPEIVRFVSVLARQPRDVPSVPMQLPPRGTWMLRVLAREGRFVIGLHRRHMMAVRYLGTLDRIFGVPVTTRSWSTITAIAGVLDGGGSRASSARRR